MSELERVLGPLAVEAVKAVGRIALTKVAEKRRRGLIDDFLDTVHERVSSRMRVKTLLNPSAPTDLPAFFWQPYLRFGDKTKQPSSVDDFPREWGPHVVLRGPAGQGKSTYVLHLALMELTSCTRLPLLIELRRYSSDLRLEAMLVEELRLLGCPEVDEGVLADLCASGRVSLILDGFDEVAEGLRPALQHEIQSLARRHPKRCMIVTSRPYTDIEAAPSFTVVEMAPLEPAEQVSFLQRLVPDQANEIVTLLGDESVRAMRALLSTPLLLSLLILKYERHGVVPETIVEFYRDLFDLFLDRHDRLKGGFRRPRAAGLGNMQLRSVFDAFCFRTKKDDLRADIPQATALSILREAIGESGLRRFNLEAVEQDLVEITGLLIRDEGRLSFLHESIQRYHAAEHVMKEGLSKHGFYKMALPAWQAWEDELFFLNEIDDYPFAKHFLIEYGRTIGSPALGGESSQCTDADLNEVFGGDQIVDGQWSFRGKVTLSFLFRGARVGLERALAHLATRESFPVLELVKRRDDKARAIVEVMKDAVVEARRRLRKAELFVATKDSHRSPLGPSP